MFMRTYNAMLAVDATVKTIYDITTVGGAPLNIASFGTRTLTIQPKDGTILYTFDRNDPVIGNAIELQQGEKLYTQGRVLEDLRIVAGTASVVAVECHYTQSCEKPRLLPTPKNEKKCIGGLTLGLPFPLGGTC